METEESQRVLPFQLQFDKPIASQIKIAEWNPEKDLLAMVTEDSKLLLHRFNWQRLWTTSPGKCITSICWRPDGKAIAVGLDDGMMLLHDVEVSWFKHFYVLNFEIHVRVDPSRLDVFYESRMESC